MVAVPMLPHVEFGRNDHREYAFHFISPKSDKMAHDLFFCQKNQLWSTYNQQKKKDFVMIEQENNQRLLKSRVQVPDKIEVDGAMRIPCHLYPDCKTVFIKALGWFSS